MFDQAENHNGGDLHFGADGYLYVSLGDEGEGNDSLNNSQIINKDFWSGILRLDVDNRPDNLAPNPHGAITPGTYRVPADNPFVGLTNWSGKTLDPATVRTEFYAVGLRNPWRIAFDPVTGFLYCGDVGQDAREEIDIIIKGGNYGWAFREGFISGPKASPPGAVHINPILDYAHGFSSIQGNSVTGGVVYRGSRIPALFGHYIFADYVSGNIWAILYDGTNATPVVRLAVDANIAGFGVDPSSGDVLMADQGEDQIKRLVPTPPSDEAFPPTLADTGAFIDLANLTPQAGIVPYDINVPFWSDNAIKTRWFYIPTNRTITFRATNNWIFPTGSVWVKHFELELTNGAASSRRRLETRFIVRDSRTNVYGVTYRWDDAQTNATLVREEGLDETFMIDDSGIPRTQVWHYPGRSECLHCHTGQGGLVLGFNTPQMNRDFDYGGIVDNQIRAMTNAGYFSTPVLNLPSLRWLAHPTNEAVSVEQRVRSYLAANCVGCHQPGALGGNSFETRLDPPLSVTRLINGVLSNDASDAANRVIVPGDPAHSMLLNRIATRGPKQMPPLDSTLIDMQAVALVTRWITNDLVSYRTFAQWQIDHFGSANAPNALAAADPDGDGADNFEEYLAYTNPNLASDAWSLRIEKSGSDVRVIYPQLVNRRVEVQWNSDPTSRTAWQFLSVPQNQPFISATNGLTALLDSLIEAPARYYRARVFEP
jgi:mono/diheme cytochrome c family protein